MFPKYLMKKYLYSPSQVSLNSPTETDFDGNKSDATATKVKLNEKFGSDDKVRTFEYESHITCSTINLLTLFKWMYIFTCGHIFMLSSYLILLIASCMNM